MTDLCDESDAEAECSKAIECAIEAEETNPEAWQTKARLQIIKSLFEVWSKFGMIPSLFMLFPSSKLVKYSGDPNTDNLNIRNIWIPETFEYQTF